MAACSAEMGLRFGTERLLAPRNIGLNKVFPKLETNIQGFHLAEKPFDCYVLNQVVYIANSTICELGDAALKRIREPREQNSRDRFQISFEKRLKSVIESTKEPISPKDPAMMSQARDKAIQFSSDFFNRSEKPIFNRKDPQCSEKINQWVKTAIEDVMHQCILSLKAEQISTGPESVAHTELQRMNPSFNLSVEKLSCAAYAFLVTNAKVVSKLIIGKSDDSELLWRIIDQIALAKFGYVPTQNPKSGDLVFYYGSDNKLRHVAVYRGEGRVESKMGSKNPRVYLHDLFLIPEIYGEQVVFVTQNRV